MLQLLIILLTILSLMADCQGREVKLNVFGYITPSPALSWNQTENGWSSLKTPYGALSFQFAEGLSPVEAQLCDPAGQPVRNYQFECVINLKLSPNRRFAAFYDGRKLNILDLHTGEIKDYPRSIVFNVDQDGQPIYYNAEHQQIVYTHQSIPISSEVINIQFFDDQPVIATRASLYTLTDNRLEEIHQFNAVFHSLDIVENDLYLVEKQHLDNEFQFTLYRANDLQTFKPIDRVTFHQPSGSDTHETIRAPLHYYETSFTSIVKNGYAQVQEWAHVYLHPGVDFFAEPYTEAYAVADGVVRAIITTGDDQYWRIAIERFDVPGEGYLYAHLNQDSFPFAVGDSVQAGEIIGTLYPAYGFSPHCHFTRVSPDVPDQWDGVWWVMDNPLVDVSNMVDSLPPVFEHAYGSELFAFRTPGGEYLDPLELAGEIDIIAKVVDYAYEIDFYSRIVPFDLRFELYEAGNPDSAVYERYSFALDMPLDTYFNLSYYTLVLETIYSRDAVCFTTNNNDVRDFYFVLTNSNGDSAVTVIDSAQVFDTSVLPDGSYLLKVIVRDSGLNETTAQMPVMIVNNSAVEHRQKAATRPDVLEILLNPANPMTIAQFRMDTAGFVRLGIFDVTGRQVEPLLSQYLLSGTRQIRWNAAEAASGLYFIRMETAQTVLARKIVVLR